MWAVFAFGSAIFAGLTAILAKFGIQGVNSNLATALRTGVVLVFSWVMVFVTGAQGGIGAISARSMAFLVLSGLATGASWLCYFKALQLGDVNKVVPIDKASTVLTMVLALMFFHEPVTPLKAAAMALIALGTFWMIQKQPQADAPAPKNGRWLPLALGSAVFASLTSILGKAGVEGVNSNLGTAIRTVVVLIMAWVVVFATKSQGGLRRISKKSWVFLVLSGFATGGSWLCYYRALQTGPASVVVPIDKLSILITIAFSYFFLHEKLTRRAAAGLALITVGTLSLLL